MLLGAIEISLVGTYIQFLPVASFDLRAFSLHASVCLCVSVCVNPEIVREITQDVFKPKQLNSDKRCKTPFVKNPISFAVD